jgi:hypothetical protein
LLIASQFCSKTVRSLNGALKSATEKLGLILRISFTAAWASSSRPAKLRVGEDDTSWKGKNRSRLKSAQVQMWKFKFRSIVF